MRDEGGRELSRGEGSAESWSPNGSGRPGRDSCGVRGVEGMNETWGSGVDDKNRAQRSPPGWGV